MQFLVTAYDGTDPEAPARRRASKDAHMDLGHRMIAAGHVLFSTAIIDADGQEIGSLSVMQYQSRAELDDWLEHEPYITQKVWSKYKVELCRMGPSFEWMTLESGGEHKLDG